MGIGSALATRPAAAEPAQPLDEALADPAAGTSVYVDAAVAIAPFSDLSDAAGDPRLDASGLDDADRDPTSPRFASAIGLDDLEESARLTRLFGETSLRQSAAAGAETAFPIETDDLSGIDDAQTEAVGLPSVEALVWDEESDRPVFPLVSPLEPAAGDVSDAESRESPDAAADAATDAPSQEGVNSRLPSPGDACSAQPPTACDEVVEDVQILPLNAYAFNADPTLPRLVSAIGLDETETTADLVPLFGVTTLREAVAPGTQAAFPIASAAPDVLAQAEPSDDAESLEDLEAAQRNSSDILGSPEIRVQGIYLLQGDESSGRGRVTGVYAFNPHVLVGATVDLTQGNPFSDSREEGLNINELYVAASPPGLANLRFVVGLIDLTSYFDRNSFAKDAATHFFNSVFQTNPALSAATITSRPGLVVNFDVTDNLILKAATFSSSRNLGDFELNGYAGEIGLRFGTAILRATYVSAEDAGEDDGFQEIFSIPRDGGDSFGLLPGDREEAFGLNGEVFIPDLNLGLFARYGWYNNLEIDEGGQTFSFGLNLLDLLVDGDRLGLGYGRQLSNSDLRRDEGDEVPDVLEVFYDIPFARNFRAGVTLQQRDGFSETVAGFRIRVDFDSREIGRLF